MLRKALSSLLSGYLWAAGLIIIPGIMICSCHGPSKPVHGVAEMPVRAEPMLIHQLGREHLGNTVYRRGSEGPRIAASGNRIIEWPIQENAPLTEVVPYRPENYNNGACALDVNGDGIDEMIVARTVDKSGTNVLWFEEVPGKALWEEHLIGFVPNEGGEKGIHDIMSFEVHIPGKALSGIAIVVNRRSLYWFLIPDNVTQPWTKYKIGDLRTHGAACAQSGLVSGDVTGDGIQDLVCGNFIAECPSDPTSGEWNIFRYSRWDTRKTPVFPEVPEWVAGECFGGMNQLDLGDMNGDGKTDIVATDAEIPSARLGVFSRDPENPVGLWKETVVDTGLYCPHNLVVTDVDNDKRPDIITGEMTAGGWWFPRTELPKLCLYLNKGNLKFDKYILHEGYGIHMMRMAPDTESNKVFVFAADEIQSWYEDMTTHVVGWTITPLR